MRRLRVPHTLVLLFAMSVAGYALSFVLPQGTYRRVKTETGEEKVLPGSYERLREPKRLSPTVLFTSIPRGFHEAQEIIFFVFLIGGCFAVFRTTDAPDAAIGTVLRRLGHRPRLLIAGGMLIFAAGSSTIGMAEEYLPFVPLLIVLCRGLGLDSVTAVGVLCVGYGVGYGAAAMNPFTVVIAQNVAGVPPTSGALYRLALFVPFFAVGLHHVLRYAKKVKDDPQKSLVADLDVEETQTRGDNAALTLTHCVVLLVTVGALVALVVGIKKWHWYVQEMGALFVALSLVLAAVARIGPSRLATTFCSGASELTTTALLIGFARTIKVILDDGMIVDTIIHGIASPLENLGPHGAAVGMFVVQSVCNFFIPSGSGQAYVTMPIMAPLADIVGVSRQVAVLAYQFGDGFTNILVPTNAVLIGILTMAKVPFDRWLRFVAPLMVKLFLVGAAALVVAVWMEYS